MKKYLSIFILSCYLFSATDLKELFKIDVVINHFDETRKNEHSVSFYQFLVMHYLTDDNNSSDNNRDMQLPFKSPDSCIANSSLVSVHNPFTAFTFQPFTAVEKDFLTQNDFFVLSNFINNVWHPPQFS